MNKSLLKQAGHYTLQSFMIYNTSRSKFVDIKSMIHTFDITESMSAGSVRGSAKVYDSRDLVTTFPLIGEEYVEITYSDFYDVAHTDRMFIYSIGDVKYPKGKDTLIEYTIYFVSAAKFLNEKDLIAKTYKPIGSSSIITDYVNDVFDQYYKKPVEAQKIKPKEIVAEETTGTGVFVIPTLTPEHTMHFFARKAFASQSKTQTFRFFENREMFFFATNEYFIERLNPSRLDPRGRTGTELTSEQSIVPKFTMNYAADKVAERQPLIMTEILDIDFGEKLNTMEDVNSGAYRRRAYEIDVLHNVVNEVAYDHLTGFSPYDAKSKEKLPHSEEFVRAQMTREKYQFFVKDYSSIGSANGDNVRPYTYYPEVYNIKGANFYHYGKNSISVKIYGRNKIKAGSIVDIELIKRAINSKRVEIDTERSGRYLVESVNNVFYESYFYQTLTLSRSGIGK